MNIIKENMSIIEEKILKPVHADQELKPELAKAIEDAIRKQVPVKPVIRQWLPTECPTCSASLSKSLGDGYYKHFTGLTVCECGQQLDWDDE